MMLDELRACERLAEERRVAMLTLMAEVDAAKAEGFRAGAEWMREQARSWVHSCTDMERMTIARWDSVLDALPTSPPAPEPHRCVRLGGDGDSCAACNNIGTHPPAPEEDK